MNNSLHIVLVVLSPNEYIGTCHGLIEDQGAISFGLFEPYMLKRLVSVHEYQI